MINVTICSFSMQDAGLAVEPAKIGGIVGNNNLPFAWHCSVYTC
jgi:hypothetical protein